MIRFHNTKSSRKEEFTPALPVKMWWCGPTVYDVPHIGNARASIVADVLFRFLRAIYGPDNVLYARNFTDIDDKIIHRALHEGISVSELTMRVIAQFNNLSNKLNILPPTFSPLATQSVEKMSSMIEVLVSKGVAYVSDDHVLFSVDSGDYTKLIHDVELVAGHRIAIEDYKRDPKDFVLWKPSKAGEPSYSGPCGLTGRPGWHIECSAMIKEYLGETIDIHGGGNDLIFPHHQCEIAQSESANETELARFWLHNGMLLVDGQKMSKSVGNFITVPDALKKAHGEALRYTLLSGHYHKPYDFSWSRLEEANAALTRLYRAATMVSTELSPSTDILDILGDDLNTPAAFSYMHSLADDIFSAKSEQATADLMFAGSILGILQLDPTVFLQQGDKDAIEALIMQRNTLRLAKKYKDADEIRQQLFDMGVAIEDTPNGTKWVCT